MERRGPVSALTYLLEMGAGWLPWMAVNLALAAVPAGLALVLFRRSRRVTPLWWAGVVAFVLFLPNAPYVLTSYRWLVGPWRNAWQHDRWRFATILPLWALYFAAGFVLFVVSVRWAQQFVGRRWSPTIGRVTVVALTLASAAGLYLGRADLFSWSVITEPDEVVGVVRRVGTGAGAPGIALAFVVLLAGYAVAVAAFERFGHRRGPQPSGRDPATPSPGVG